MKHVCLGIFVGIALGAAVGCGLQLMRAEPAISTHYTKAAVVTKAEDTLEFIDSDGNVWAVDNSALEVGDCCWLTLWDNGTATIKDDIILAIDKM